MQGVEFEKLVKQSVLELPEKIRKTMENVAIVVEKRPSQEELKKAGIRIGGLLLGLYQGLPKTTWARSSRMRMPDKITIFQEPLERVVNSKEELKKVIKRVVRHEIAHHFGFDEKSVRRLERNW